MSCEAIKRPSQAGFARLLFEHELSGVTFDELIGTAEQEYRERQREQAIRSAPQKRPCIPGDIVYLENDKAFIVQDIGEGEILLQDQELPLFSRSVSREEFSRLLERNERNKHLQAPAISDTATPVLQEETTASRRLLPTTRSRDNHKLVNEFAYSVPSKFVTESLNFRS